MPAYTVTHAGFDSPAFRGSLSECLKAVASFIGGFDGRERVTLWQATESSYRIVKA